MYIPKEKQMKVECRAWKGIFVGYMDSPRIYLVYNPVKNKIVRATAVTFDENKRYSLGESKEPRQKGCSSEETVLSDNAITTEEEEEKKTEGYTGYQRSSTASAIVRQLGQPSERSQAITVEAHRYND